MCNGGSSDIKDSIKNKISFTQDTSKNTVFLQGKNFQAEDTAVYYCARDTVIKQDTAQYKNLNTSIRYTIPHYTSIYPHFSSNQKML